MSANSSADARGRQLSFVAYDQAFLEKSWAWLHDPEIKRLTMTPDFTREAQARWFEKLPTMKDYSIWGISCDGVPIGAIGLKHVTKTDAEYWGYIGERSYWGKGLGKQLMQFAAQKAREIGLSYLYLKVQHDNDRAAGLYKKFGFKPTSEKDGIIQMRLSVNEAYAG